MSGSGTEGILRFHEWPKVVGYWCMTAGEPTVKFVMYAKPTDEQIAKHTELLGWVWEDAK